jgi:hypothetical protein
MRKPVLLSAAGIALILLALLWFFTPLFDGLVGYEEADDSVRGEGTSTIASWVGNIANICFAAIGTYFNYLGYKLAKPAKDKPAGEEAK